MKLLNTKLLLSSLMAAAAFTATVSHAADENKLQQAYKSTNVKVL